MKRELSHAIFFLFLFILSSQVLFAQDDLLNELEQSKAPDVDYAFQTFKGTRLVNGQSVETKAKGTLEFIFAHRFGAINSGSKEMFGLDQAHVRLGLEYGITDRLGIGIGRSGYDKIKDGYVRYKIFKQKKGAKNFPVTMTAFGSISYKASLPTNEKVDRLAYVGQLLIARKFSPKLSLQLMPTVVHRNSVNQIMDRNTQMALGMGGRIKVSKSIALTSEYYYRIDPKPNVGSLHAYNAIGLGIDIETGGHVFQLVMTNTRGTLERAFITETGNNGGVESGGNIADGNVFFGFNITRTFQLKKK
jgi:hypothetical protein